MTINAPQAAARIREALEHCPAQQSVWERIGATIYELTDYRYRGTNRRVNRWSAQIQTARQPHEVSQDEADNLAAYIAACSPDNLRAILDRMDELAKDAARLREALSDLLDDTQHSDHNCGDPECPVDIARAALTPKD